MYGKFYKVLPPSHRWCKLIKRCSLWNFTYHFTNIFKATFHTSRRCRRLRSQWGVSQSISLFLKSYKTFQTNAFYPSVTKHGNSCVLPVMKMITDIRGLHVTRGFLLKIERTANFCNLNIIELSLSFSQCIIPYATLLWKYS